MVVKSFVVGTRGGKQVKGMCGQVPSLKHWRNPRYVKSLARRPWMNAVSTFKKGSKSDDEKC